MNTADIPMLRDKLTYWVDNNPQRSVLHQPVDGDYRCYTWELIADTAYRLSSFFAAQGIVKGDKVAILSRNCAEWIITDIALMLSGIVSVPLYPNAQPDNISYILQHSECKLCVVGKLNDWRRVVGAINDDIVRVGLPYDGIMPVHYQWADIIAKHDVNRSLPDIQGSDLMTILFTSGSTGLPKGVMHSYDGFVRGGKNAGLSLGVTCRDRAFAYLTLSHCTERNFVSSVMLNYGVEIYFNESLETFVRDINYCRPTMFSSVPRLWTKFQKRILTTISEQKLQFVLKIPALGSFVRRKIKRDLGLGSTRVFMSGSAPLSPQLSEWYERLGIQIAQGWGMTETFACGSLPYWGAEVKTGTVSQPIHETEIAIADDEEILLKSSSVMLGYYKDEAKTSQLINSDGYIHTGDLGKLEGGYLSIVGRKKDIFKSENGKCVAPIPIENQFATNQYIEQMCLMGTQLEQPVLVVNLSKHSKRASKAKLTSSLTATMNSVNQTLESHEKVGGVIVACDNWSTKSGELTPTLKVKRHVIEKTFFHAAQSINSGEIAWY